ncbi:MAG TPA: ABC transporter permease [Candidatus Dormibacteraeota bacterium]|nr:ABC transporter permease [Candidatus Dormibacteraeota bacterium]
MPRLPETLNTFYLIARREFLTRVRSRFFVIGTLVLMVLLAGYIVLQTQVINRTVPTSKLAFVGDAQVLAQPLQAAANAEGIKLQIRSVPDLATGEAQVRSGALDALISGDATSPQVDVKEDLSSTIAAPLNQIVKAVALNRALAASGSDPSVVEGKVAGAGINVRSLDPNATVRTQREVVGIFTAALLYVALLLYGQLVAMGVIEEKANRIIEILLSTVRPRQLLFGKVAGIGLMGCLQLALLGVVGLVATSRTHAIIVPNVGIVAVAGGLVWFVLGFVLFALIYAAGGSLVSRQEDAGAVIAPITMLIVGTYLAYFFVAANPDNPIGVAMSIVPPFSPILMPGRIATGDATAWQIALSVVLAIAAILGMNALAARIYTNSVLRIGARVGFVEAWRGVA